MHKFIYMILFFLTPSLLHAQETGAIMTGVASFYAGKFEGLITANGERFSNSDFTAAHKTYPFHTLVRVTNPKNNKTIVVRINDRGPHIKGRMIDLSRAAANKIGLDAQGIVSVEMILPRNILLTGDIESAFSSRRFSDCVGNECFLNGITIFLWHTNNLQHMLYLANDLDDFHDHGKVVIERKENNYRLLLTGFLNHEETLEALKSLKRQGFFSAMLYEE